METGLSPAEETDFEFAFDAKHQALGAYVEALWVGDNPLQRGIHRRRRVERPWSIIVLAGR